MKGPSGRVGNYRHDELVAEPDLLITIPTLSDLVDPKTGKLKVADRSCFYMRLTGGLSEQDAEILEQALQGVEELQILTFHRLFHVVPLICRLQVRVRASVAQVLDVGSVVIMAGPPEVVEANMPLGVKWADPSLAA